jgi:hypothetical protein
MPYTYDPGEPYDGPPPDSSRRRRKRRRPYQDEYDDAWAAAHGDAEEYGVDPGALAAGYDWADERFEVDRVDAEDDEWEGGRTVQGVPYRARGMTPPVRAGRRYDPYPHSASYRRDAARRGPARHSAALVSMPGPLAHIPCWGIVILVMLGVMALVAVAFACVAVLAL